ncbi:MAG TPA: exodeoxyribonuclease III [Kineosporiaceae bacterium]|nr:exodeoxyribonuclease III [Kineosporiaceae bacterium]
MTRVLTVASANVNGIRAAVRRGVDAWLEQRRPDVLCLQEVRAPDSELRAVFGHGWYGVHAEAAAAGRAGVAVLSRVEPAAVRVGLGDVPGGAEFDTAGRWVEADLPLAEGPLTVVSVYVHKGEAGTAKQEEKYRFLEVVTRRMAQLAEAGRRAVVCGDLNIAHREVDLKNWKGNLDHAGFLPQERAWLDELLGGPDWADVHRALAGEGPGPYTWWSWRGKAFDNDAGWRIDYQLATAPLAGRAVKAEADRADSYAQRWSDHAAVVVGYDLDPRAATA